MGLKLPKVIGHRGACAYAPENTIESILTAADIGAEWVELDVMLTQDGVPIIFHDDTLDRTTNGSGNVAETPYATIRELEAGSWYADSFAGIKIPTLEEALEILIDKNLGLNLEIKPTPGRERETAESALDILSKYWDDHEHLLISSFQLSCLETAQDMAPDWYRGVLFDDDEDMPENLRDLFEYVDGATVNIGKKIVTRELVEDIIDFEKPVLVYTVNDAQLARQLQGWGVDAVFSDCPDVIAQNLLKVH
ncbi:MAG: glycerophosphoryl diester phosphodiesterase [Micavibrio aeruginosavorus]|nr:glycerophosphoryl diester phosphodiesterase [Micavibrio aeruginosavorus]